MIKLTVNGRARSVDVEPEMPLLWVLRDELKMCGTKYGCGIGVCGACTVHVDGQPMRSCSVPVSSVAGKKIVTIEGIGNPGLQQGPDGMDPPRRAPMRLLPGGNDHGRHGVAREEPEAQR